MKIIIATLILIISTLTIHAQVDRTNFRAGITAGLVTGDASDFFSFNLGLDILHVWGVSKTLDVGLATGFNNAFGEEETVELGDVSANVSFANLQYIPAAAAFRIYPSYGFKFGGDVGYAIGVSNDFDGGFYYKPVIGFDISGNTELNFSYAAISDESTFGTALVGILFLF